MNYHIISYGCQMNEYDSARLAALLELQGMRLAKNSEEADIILVNTCSVRAKAEESAIARIRDLKPLKSKNKNLKIGVLGCMAKNRGETLLKDLPFLDFVLPPDKYEKLPFAKLANNYSAFIAIQSGCNMKCSYCIVPYVRGMEQYREPDSVLKEIEEAASKGVSEVMLLGQTVNGYRYKGLNFSGLLKQVACINGVERIRFMSPHPRLYTGELLNLLLSEPKMAAHVHLPVQSGSNSVLKKMKRLYTRENYLSIVEALRKSNSLYGITTDIICGYPGETEEEFEETLSLINEAQFDSAFTFAYSSREGTPAALEKELISEEQKKARLQKTIDLQNSITLERARLMLGRKEKVLLEKPSRKNSGQWVGKTGNLKKVIVPAQPNFKEGMYINCTINGIKGHTLLAVLIFFLFLASCGKKENKRMSDETSSSSQQEKPLQEENQLQSDIKIDENLEYEEIIYTSTFNNVPANIRTVATNVGEKSHKVTFQYWLGGDFSQEVSITKEIPPRTRMAIEPGREIKLTRNAFAIKHETQTVLQTRFYGLDGGKKVLLFERSYKIKLLPPQFFNWQTPELIVAFVTYQMDSIPALQREISQKVGSILSYQAGPERAEEQVKAVYEIIADRRWHYVTGFSISAGGQRVRYPAETLREKSANCIEGTLLFSAIIESLNIETAIVLVNRPQGRHAYLAWKSDPRGEFDKFIETTAAFSASNIINYEKAASIGGLGAYEDEKAGYIEKIIPVRKMWNSGISLNEVP